MIKSKVVFGIVVAITMTVAGPVKGQEGRDLVGEIIDHALGIEKNENQPAYDPPTGKTAVFAALPRIKAKGQEIYLEVYGLKLKVLCRGEEKFPSGTNLQVINLDTAKGRRYWVVYDLPDPGEDHPLQRMAQIGGTRQVYWQDLPTLTQTQDWQVLTWDSGLSLAEFPLGTQILVRYEDSLRAICYQVPLERPRSSHKQEQIGFFKIRFLLEDGTWELEDPQYLTIWERWQNQFKR